MYGHIFLYCQTQHLHFPVSTLSPRSSPPLLQWILSCCECLKNACSELLNTKWHAWNTTQNPTLLDLMLWVVRLPNAVIFIHYFITGAFNEKTELLIRFSFCNPWQSLAFVIHRRFLMTGDIVLRFVIVWADNTLRFFAKGNFYTRKYKIRKNIIFPRPRKF